MDALSVLQDYSINSFEPRYLTESKNRIEMAKDPTTNPDSRESWR